MSSTETTSAPPLAKLLASTDKKTRDKAIASLSTFLSSASADALSPLEMARLWKGIFYCFWMSDKPRVQQALAQELADIVLRVSSVPGALAYLAGFWEAVTREWTGIDRLRMDKYMLLVRRFVNATFRLLQKQAWEESVWKTNEEMLTRRGAPLCPDDPRVPASLTYHISDIYLEELDKVLAEEAEGKEDVTHSAHPPAPLDVLIRPFFAIACRSTAKVKCLHVQNTVIVPLLVDLQGVSSKEGEETKAEMTAPPARKRQRLETSSDATYPHVCVGSTVADVEEGTTDGVRSMLPGEVRKKLLAMLFEMASAEETRDANRRRLYAVWKEMKADDDDEEDEADDV